VFAAVFLFLDFILTRLIDGAPGAFDWIGWIGFGACILIAFVAARGSYRRTLGKPAPKSWRLY
jgi:hypothetical protein